MNSVLKAGLLMLCAGSVSAGPARALVEKFVGDSARIIKEYPSVPGMTGFVVTPPGKPEPMVMYADDAGRYIIAGAIFTPDGRNLTSLETEKYVPKPDLREMLTEASRTNFIEVGNPKAKRLIYIVAEPNCIYCKREYAALKSRLDNVRVRWIMIGFNPAGDAKAKAMIASKDKLKALDSVYGAGEPIQGGDGISLAKNEAFSQKWGIRGTPYLFYANKGVVEAKPGLVADAALDAIIASASE